MKAREYRLFVRLSNAEVATLCEVGEELGLDMSKTVRVLIEQEAERLAQEEKEAATVV